MIAAPLIHSPSRKDTDTSTVWSGGFQRLARLLLSSILAVVAIAGLAACSQRLPKDPAAQIAEIRRRMDAAYTSNQKSSWLVHAADNPTTAARDLLLESLGNPNLNLSAAASELLRVRWVKDPTARRRIRAYYLDPTRSYRNRKTLYDFLLKRYRDTYPEFADLPKTPPVLPGRVHIQGELGDNPAGAGAAKIPHESNVGAAKPTEGGS